MKDYPKYGVAEPTGDYFGGTWTEEKIAIFIKYCHAFLAIMKNRSYKLIYFDGFAGSGEIIPTNGVNPLESVALQVMAIDKPVSFDLYYLVELQKSKVKSLENLIIEKFPSKRSNTHIICEDCNSKIAALSAYLKKHSNYRALAFLDPFGMSVDFKSLESFKQIGCDMWILFPSGIGVNRMLMKREEAIPQSWYAKLEKVMGMTAVEIKKHFYKINPQTSMFEDGFRLQKQEDPINRIIELYSIKLKTIWDHVSKPHAMKNSNGSIMFHFLLVSQNQTAVKVADDIVKKYK